MEFKNITIIGDGAMATSCAMLLNSKNKKVTMWSPFEDNINNMTTHHENRRYLPGIPLSQSIQFTTEKKLAFGKTDLIVASTPTQYIRSVWEQIKPDICESAPVVSVAKGIENQTLRSPTQIIADVLQDSSPRHLATLSGPSIATEIARCLPATVCVASTDLEFAKALQDSFSTNWFRVYTNSDLLGVELAGAVKNVIALAAGIIDGLQAGYNAKSALLSRGLAEITRLGVAMGANAETFFGITGVGDLATTCFCPEGRNRTAGEMLGKGLKLDQVLEKIEGIVEGVPTAGSVVKLAKQYNIEMPITEAVYAVLFEDLDPIDGIARLMQRTPRSEKVG